MTGINAIIYYADTIFAAAGFTSVAGQTAATTWAIGGVNVLATLIAVAFVDRLGRKPLLVAGLIGMAVSLTVVGIAFMSIPDVATGVSSGANASGPSDAGIITLVALVVYIASFAFSLGPVVCTMINEIFPRAIRSRAVAVSTAAIWLSAWLVSQFFLSLINGIGESATFWLFAVLCVVCLGWVWRRCLRRRACPWSRSSRCGPVGQASQAEALVAHATVDTRLIGLPGVLDLRSRQP